MRCNDKISIILMIKNNSVVDDNFNDGGNDNDEIITIKILIVMLMTIHMIITATKIIMIITMDQ